MRTIVNFLSVKWTSSRPRGVRSMLRKTGGSLLADTLSLRVLQITEYKMKQSSPAGFDHASHSEPEMLARLRNYKTANQIRNRLREIGLRTTRTRVALGNI